MKLISEIEEALEVINTSEKDFYSRMNTLMPMIGKAYEEFIQIVPRLNAIGMNIEYETIVQQLKNLGNAIEYRDLIDIYDEMKLEIIPTLSTYDEILRIMEEKE